MQELMQPERAFDYSRYMEETAQILQDNASSLRGRKADIVLAIGRAVIEARRLLPKGELEEYVSLALGVDTSAARKCVKVVDVLGHVDRATLSNMSVDTMFYLSRDSFPPDALLPVLAAACDGPITRKDAEAIAEPASEPASEPRSEPSSEPSSEPAESSKRVNSPATDSPESDDEDKPSEWEGDDDQPEWEDVDDDEPIADAEYSLIDLDDLLDRIAQESAKLVLDGLWTRWNESQRISAALFMEDQWDEPESISSFDQFWDAYPPRRKRDKKKAKAAFDKAVKDGASAAEIIAAAQEYAQSDEGRGEYCAGPVPWLNGGRWEDDRSSWYSTTSRSVAGYLEQRGTI